MYELDDVMNITKYVLIALCFLNRFYMNTFYFLKEKIKSIDRKIVMALGNDVILQIILQSVNPPENTVIQCTDYDIYFNSSMIFVLFSTEVLHTQFKPFLTIKLDQQKYSPRFILQTVCLSAKRCTGSK